MKTLYRFDWDLYYASAEGLFVADPAAIKAAIGKQLHFGSIEGKHSEISGPLELGDLTLISEDPLFVAEFERLLPRGVGYNPLDYLSENA